MISRAVVLLPSDRMGGAERVVRTLALEAARSRQFDRVEIFVLCWSRSGTLDDFDAIDNVGLHYTLARNERSGILPMVRFLMRHRYLLVFTSHTHISALCSLMRHLRLLRTERLVSRESTVIFERDFGMAGHVFRTFYRVYGAQDLIVCQTERMRSSIDHYTRGKFRHLLKVLPNPIDFERVEKGRRQSLPPEVVTIPGDRTKIVWCGRLSPVKSPVRAVETLRALHDLGHKHMHLVVIGDGPLRGDVEAALHHLGLDQYVTLVGFQSNPIATMAHCDLGLLTSDVEGFPNVILEMLAAGVKGVVTTDCAGGLHEIPGVLVCSEENTVRLSKRLLELPLDAADPAINAFLRSREPKQFLNVLTC